VNAVPLTNPDGRVVAWQCGVCLHIPSVGAMYMGEAPVVAYANSSKRSAESCCRCERCGGGLSDGYRHGVCAKCKLEADAEQAKREAEWAAEAECRIVVQEEALAGSNNRASALALAELMSDISEECYCAGWMMGLEYALWDMVLGGSRRYGQSEASEEQVAEMRRLSERAGGWVRWQDDVGEVFVPLDEWVAEYASRLSDFSASLRY
jgi:hypothetical protein